MRAIDAGALIRYISNIEREDDDRLFTFEEIKKMLKNAPTIKPEVRHGHWIPVDGEPYAKCSYCGEKHYGCTTPYCDMCGAYMRKEGEEDAGTD